MPLTVNEEVDIKIKRANQAFITGISYYKNGDFDSASKEFSSAMSFQANNSKYYFARANCYKSQNKFEQY